MSLVVKKDFGMALAKKGTKWCRRSCVYKY